MINDFLKLDIVPHTTHCIMKTNPALHDELGYIKEAATGAILKDIRKFIAVDVYHSEVHARLNLPAIRDDRYERIIEQHKSETRREHNINLALEAR